MWRKLPIAAIAVGALACVAFAEQTNPTDPSEIIIGLLLLPAGIVLSIVACVLASNAARATQHQRWQLTLDRLAAVGVLCPLVALGLLLYGLVRLGGGGLGAFAPFSLLFEGLLLPLRYLNQLAQAGSALPLPAPLFFGMVALFYAPYFLTALALLYCLVARAARPRRVTAAHTP